MQMKSTAIEIKIKQTNSAMRQHEPKYRHTMPKNILNCFNICYSKCGKLQSAPEQSVSKRRTVQNAPACCEQF
jgi:hypothetical protein